MPYDPNAKQRMEALDDLQYEIQQLVFTLGPATGNVVIDRALLESRLLHVRNILDFFGRAEHHQDDVLATHYGFPFSPVSIDAKYDDRLNKDLAHLTYARTERNLSDKPWPTALVVAPILERCDQFIDHILQTRSVFAAMGPTEWRALQLVVRQALETHKPRQGV
jgi:hypothetical protein